MAKTEEEGERKKHGGDYKTRISAEVLEIDSTSTYVQGGKKSLSMTIVDKFYTFDLMEVLVKNLTQNWSWSWISQFFFLFCIPFIAKVKLDQGKMGKKFLDHLGRVRPNSDFMVLDTWMSILRNFHIKFHQHLIYHSCSISVSINN